MVKMLEIGEFEHLFLLLLSSFLVGVLKGGETGNERLLKRLGGKRKERRGLFTSQKINWEVPARQHFGNG